MTHNEVYNKLKSVDPSISEKVCEWFGNGHNSIRVRSITGNDYIFTCEENGDDWKLETLDLYLKGLRSSLKEYKQFANK